MTHGAIGHRTEADRAELLRRPAFELGRDLIPPGRIVARTAGDRRHLVEQEGQQNGLFKPLINVPVPADFFGDARFARIHQIKCRIHRIAHFALGFTGNGIPGFPGFVDRTLQGGVAHFGRNLSRIW